MTWVKICGITTPKDALIALEAGVDAIGLNFIEGSKRQIDVGVARSIAAAVWGRLELVGVVAGGSTAELLELIQNVGLDTLQLHGEETASDLNALLPRAYKAVPIGDAADVALADVMPGERILVDAKVNGARGGTGVTFDWNLVADLAQRRSVILAGGLNPTNVASAIAAVKPLGVDVASGVEAASDPRRKDPTLIHAFARASGKVPREAVQR